MDLCSSHLKQVSGATVELVRPGQHVAGRRGYELQHHSAVNVALLPLDTIERLELFEVSL